MYGNEPDDIELLSTAEETGGFDLFSDKRSIQSTITVQSLGYRCLIWIEPFVILIDIVFMIYLNVMVSKVNF